MPAIPTGALLIRTVLDRDLNTTSDALQVVCAWPVSGQYGPGSRILYYGLVIACVLARKVEWLKKACLAAALLLPAVAAIHGIVLAIVHTDAAVDMDVYGAFQLCAIGILAAPVTVKLSSTYFNDRGRNIIFAWTGLILAGLLSLVAEFYRINATSCPADADGNPLTESNRDAFPYDENFTCGLVCDIGPGNPWSPMRDWNGSTNNIYVVPAPHILTFGTGTLLSAACCLPAILSLITMWNRIAEFNWRQRFLHKEAPRKAQEVDETIEGTNGATTRQMKTVQEDIKKYLKVAVEIPVFGAAVLAIVILGEKNFWSRQVRYQTEPMASVGQWGPIVGTGLAAMGSLYMLLAKAAEEEEADSMFFPDHAQQGIITNGNLRASHLHGRQAHHSSSESLHRVSLQGVGTGLKSVTSRRSHLTDAGNRKKFAAALNRMGNYIGQPARKRYDYSEFRSGPATNYPEIPGEGNRNRELSQIRRNWPTPSVREQASREASPESAIDINDDPGRQSPQSPQTPSSVQWPATPPRAVRASTMPTRQGPSPLLAQPSSSAGEIRGRSRQRRDTLEVPSPTHITHIRNSIVETTVPTMALAARGHAPAIVVSAEPDSLPPSRNSLSPEGHKHSQSVDSLQSR